MTSYFSRVFEDEKNEDLEGKVSKQELKATL
jgi:hypothetical protein